MDTVIPPSLDPALEPLLQPLSEADPCGPAMRYDPVFTEIRLAREEDDPSLPMRQWERPLRKADWPLIENLCRQTLATRTKDLQLAAWLAEAWTRQEGLRGFVRGLQLVRALLERYWEPLHPRIDDGDADARVAPLEWVNENLSLTLKVHVALLPLVDRKPSRISFADWERLSLSELASQEEDAPAKPAPRAAKATKAAARPADADPSEPPLTRGDVILNVRTHSLAAVRAQLQHVHEAIAITTQLSLWLDGQLGLDAPNLGKLSQVLMAIERALLQLAPPPEPSQDKVLPTLNDRVDLPVIQLPEDQAMEHPLNTSPAEAPAAAAPLAPTAGWRNRDEAYRTLEALADYLGRIEPHSPTPYLIRRAVNWGRMPLPELMAEIMREEGDLNRMMHVLGLNK